MEYHNIIVRMPNWLGDVVMATPLLKMIKERWPKASLTTMIPAHLAPLLYGNPYINEMFLFSKSNEFSYRNEKRDMVARLKQGKYDLGILLTNSFSSAVLFWKGGIYERVGFATEWRRLFLTKALSMPKEKQKIHLVSLYKKLLSPFGVFPSVEGPKLYITEEERKAAHSWLEQYHIPKEHKIIGINPLAAYGEAKCWPKDRFCELARKLVSKLPVTLLFFGDAAGASIVKEICTDMPPSVINLAGLTNLRELMALIETVDLFITNDSGPMHVAAALKTPLIALFGSTNEIATGPYQHGKVIHKHVECSPCYLRTCPIDFRCMKKIAVDEVYDEVVKALIVEKKARLS